MCDPWGGALGLVTARRRGLASAEDRQMPKAVLRNGLIYPLEPLPADWQDGAELCVEKPAAEDLHAARAAAWIAEIEKLAAEIPPGEDERLEAALAAVRQQAKQSPPRLARLE